MARSLEMLPHAAESVPELPEWGREMISAIVSNPTSACLPLIDAPGGEAVARDLKILGWVALWVDRDDGPHVTLTPWASYMLGLAIAEDVAVTYEMEKFDEEKTTVKRTVDRKDLSVSIELSVKKVHRRICLTKIREVERWGTQAEADRPIRMPRVDGFVPLGIPELTPAPEPPKPSPRPALAREIKILDRVADVLRPKPGTAKKKGKKARRGKARS